MKDLLEIKREIKKKKPIFRRVEKHRKKRLSDNWRKPKGHHSKVRRKERPKGKMPLIGRSTPKALKHTDKKGRQIILINNIEDLNSLKKDTIGVISKNLGFRKKKIIAEKVEGKGYAFMNFKPEEVLKKAEEKKKRKRAEKKKPAIKPSKKPKKQVEKPAKPKKPEKPKKKPEKPGKISKKKKEEAKALKPKKKQEKPSKGGGK